MTLRPQSLGLYLELYQLRIDKYEGYLMDKRHYNFLRTIYL
jgi:hypothetical protein